MAIKVLLQIVDAREGGGLLPYTYGLNRNVRPDRV